MAEKRDMDNLKAFVTYAAERDKRVLVLIDEPYRGTVDEESAERIYQLGQFVAPLDCVMMMLATHVKKPVSLENDTNRAFANYHAEIREVYDHNNQPKGFKRLFKLERGVADWWFNDAARRSRFIDWLGHVCIAKS
jgi:DNA mismatch repair ATPase MutS